MSKLLRRIHYLLNRRQLERELEQEMAAHREMMADDRRGAFGHPLLLREDARDAWGWVWLVHFRQDLAYAARGFLRERRFALSTMIAITLAVGAATAVFSVVDRSLFRPLPYRHADRLVSVGLAIPSFGPGEYMFLGAYRDWQASSQTALDLTSWSGATACDAGVEALERLDCARIEATFLPALGVQPVLGRNFTAEEDTPGSETVAIVSNGIWRTRFGSDPGVLGKRVTIDDISARIVGVLPAGFEMPDLSPADLFLPQKQPASALGKRNVMVKVVGRLRANHSAHSAAVALSHPLELFRSDFATRVGSQYAKEMRLHIAGIGERQLMQYRLGLWMLLGAAAAFILIACANVTNMLLARSAARRREFALRAALGASRERLIRQSLTESAVLGVAGGAAGCGLAWLLLRLFIALAPDGTLRLREATLDLRVLTFALVLSLGAAFVFGLAPSLDRLRFERLHRSRHTWFRQALVAGQISISLLLLTGAGLLLTSLWRLQNVPPGFQAERVITASFTLPAARYSRDAAQLNFFDQLEARLNDLPGTIAVGLTDSLPPGPSARVVAHSCMGPETSGSIKWRYVTPGYFAAMGIPIRRGRGFSEDDRQAGVRNEVVSEALARCQFGDQDPIGKHRGKSTIVGVAGDVRNAGLDRPSDPEFYVVRKSTWDGMPGSGDPAWPRRASIVLRSKLGEAAAAGSLRAAIREIEPGVPVKVEAMGAQVDRFLARPRFQTALLAMFALTGLILSAIGLYGVVSFLVAERTREIGIRVALGAGAGDVTKMVVLNGARWTVIGLMLGIVFSLVASRLMRGLLYDVRPLDAGVHACAVTVLAVVAILAAWLPARRAARVDPIVALRHD